MGRIMRFWGEAPQREYTRRRLCPGSCGSHWPVHIARWWRWIDPARRDGWHCSRCDLVAPETSPIDGSIVEHPVSARGAVATEQPQLLAA